MTFFVHVILVHEPRPNASSSQGFHVNLEGEWIGFLFENPIGGHQQTTNRVCQRVSYAVNQSCGMLGTIGPSRQMFCLENFLETSCQCWLGNHRATNLWLLQYFPVSAWRWRLSGLTLAETEHQVHEVTVRF